MEDYANSEAKRCLHCKNPMCQKGCPIGTNIPEVIALYQEGKLDEAGKMLFENNPLSAICAIVCDHETQCQGNCLLGKKGEPVHFSKIEQEISLAYLEKLDTTVPAKNGNKVAIIGGGPAGITIAIILAKKGYDITIFENHSKIGGVLRYGIPDFRLPREIVDLLQDKLIKMGIRIRPNVVIGRSISVDDLLEDGYGAVFIGTGVWKPNRLRIPGETFGHVHFAIDYLRSPDTFTLGDRVAIVGAGNSAMDAARTAIRKGAKNVYLLCRRNVSRASQCEIDAAVEDGVKFMYGASPEKIVDEGIYYTQKTFDAENNPVSEKTGNLLGVDSVIIAVSQGSLHRVVKSAKGLEMNDKDRLEVDEMGHTSREGIFAAGDVKTGAKTVVEAVRDAKIVAEEIDKYLMKNEK